MLRNVIKIDEDACTGCGVCVDACHEGAIGLVDGKARLLRDDYCDGLGDCLPECPAGAISFETREAAAYDAEAVIEAKTARIAELLASDGLQAGADGACPGAAFAAPLERRGGRPGSAPRSLGGARRPRAARVPAASAAQGAPSQLAQWPCQIKLVPTSAPYFADADLLVAADCCAYAYAGFHAELMAGRVTLIGCPKLDMVDYSEKLAQILRDNSVRSVVVARMEVPCCGGLEHAVREAVERSGRDVPAECVTFAVDGGVLARERM